MVHYPAQANVHRDGILAITSAHAGNLPPALGDSAVAATRAIAEGLNYVGVLCVEFFVLQDGSLIVNEMAPRPHNSGHYTLDACDVSQFELQVRTLAGLPLSAPRQHSPAIMLNLLGELWINWGQIPIKSADAAQLPVPTKLESDPNYFDLGQLLALPGLHLHLYGKLQPKPGRKMGHLTISAATVVEVKARALLACRLLGIEPLADWLAP